MRSATCEGCGGAVPYTRERCGNGYRVKARCLKCNKAAETTAEGNPRTWYQLSAFEVHELEAMPFDGEQALCMCGFCKEPAALEQHHLFPREAYGDACDKGPTIDLCGKCHADWHARMRRVGIAGELREMRHAGQRGLADAIGKAHDAWRRRPKRDDASTLPLAAAVSSELAAAIERARKASEGE